MSGDGPPREFWFGEWLVQPSLNQLCAGEKVVHLRPKVMDVLSFLARHPGEVVGKDDLIEGVWAKKFLADTALSRAVFELREALGDDPHHPRFVETIPKRGYRLVAPIRTVSEPSPVASAPIRRRERARYIWLGAGLCGVIVAALGVGRLLAGLATSGAGAAVTGPTKVAVLPFETLGPAEDESFTRGLTEEIASRLATLADVEVVAGRPSGGATVPGRGDWVLAQELGARLVLSGTVRWDGSGNRYGRVRVIPRLVREGGAYQWAQVYDRTVMDPLSTQAEIAESVVHQVRIAVQQGGLSASASAPSTNPDAYEAYLRGRQYMRQVDGAEGQLLAARMLERAVESDPQFTLAWASLAAAHGRLFHFGFDRTPTRREAARLAVDNLVRLAPDDPATHVALASHAFLVEVDNEKALAEIELAEQRGGSVRSCRAVRGYVLRRMGRLEEAHAALLEALENAPPDPWLYCEVGITAMMLGRFGEADRMLARATELAPDQHTAYEWRSLVILLWKGSREQARQELERMPALARAPVALAWWRQELLDGNPAAALARLHDLPGDVCALQYEFFPRELLEAEAHALAGDRDKARAAYAAAVKLLDAEARLRPDDPRVPGALALALAGLGRRTEALQAGERALAMSMANGDVLRASFAEAWLARSHLLTGDPDSAARLAVKVLEGPAHPAAVPLLWLDPRWAELRDHPLVQAVTLGRPT